MILSVCTTYTSVKHLWYTHILPGLWAVAHPDINTVCPTGWQVLCYRDNNSSSLTLFVLLANSRVTSNATKNGKSMCKSLLHNPLLQQWAQSAAGCGLNENTPKPSRRLICNPSPGYSSQNNTTQKIKTLVFVSAEINRAICNTAWCSVTVNIGPGQKEKMFCSSHLWNHCNWT